MGKNKGRRENDNPFAEKKKIVAKWMAGSGGAAVFGLIVRLWMDVGEMEARIRMEAIASSAKHGEIKHTLEVMDRRMENIDRDTNSRLDTFASTLVADVSRSKGEIGALRGDVSRLVSDTAAMRQDISLIESRLRERTNALANILSNESE